MLTVRILLQSIQGDNNQATVRSQSRDAVPTGNHLLPEVCTLLENMVLVGGDEISPDIPVLPGDLGRPRDHDVVREDVVVSQCWHYG